MVYWLFLCCGIFTEPHVMWLWLWLVVVNMLLKSGTLSFLRELRTNRTYLYFIKSAIFSILVSKNKWLVWAVRGWKLIIWSAFPWSFKSFLKYCLFWFWPQILQAYVKWELKIEKYIVLKRCLGTKCLIFDNKPTVRLSFLPRFDRYLFQSRSFSV